MRSFYFFPIDQLMIKKNCLKSHENKILFADLSHAYNSYIDLKRTKAISND